MHASFLILFPSFLLGGDKRWVCPIPFFFSSFLFFWPQGKPFDFGQLGDSPPGISLSLSTKDWVRSDSIPHCKFVEGFILDWVITPSRGLKPVGANSTRSFWKLPFQPKALFPESSESTGHLGWDSSCRRNSLSLWGFCDLGNLCFFSCKCQQWSHQERGKTMTPPE